MLINRYETTDFFLQIKYIIEAHAFSDLHMSDRHDVDEFKRKTTLASCSWYQVIVSIYFLYCYPAASQNRTSYRNMNS